jgi:aminotransferase
VQTEHRDRLAAHLLKNGIYTTFRYYPLHLVKHYQARCELPGAEYANRFTLNLPLHQNLSDDDVGRIIRLVEEFRP